MRRLLFCISLICHLSGDPGFAAQAQQSFFPDMCPHTEGILEAENPTSEEESIWAQYDHPHFVEKRFILKPGALLKIPLWQFLNTDQSFAVKSFQPKLKLTLRCSGEKTSGDLASALWIRHDLSQSQHAVHYLINLSPEKNIVSLEFRNLWGQVLQTQKLELANYFESQKLKWKVPAGTTSMIVKATGRINSQVFDQKLAARSSKVLMSPALLTNPEKKYFLASTKYPPFESFVFALSEDRLIVQARQQLADPSLEKIIVGYIQLGHQNTNRDFHSPGAAPYSWSVEEVTSFADFAHIDCDGSPRLVEERIFERLDQKNSHICFWSYRVVRELSPEEVSTGKIKSTQKP